MTDPPGGRTESVSTASQTWAAEDRLRGLGLRLDDIVATLDGESLGDTRRRLANFARRGMWDEYPSEFVTGFIARALAGQCDVRILDPWASAGVLLADVADAVAPSRAVGLVRRSPLDRIAKKLLPAAQWLVGEPVQHLADLRRQGAEFDVVVCAPPWNMRSDDGALPPGTDKRLYKVPLEQRLVWSSCQLLAPTGRALFFLPDRFLLDSKQSGIRALLREQGFYLWSAVSLPPSWNEGTSIPGNLVEIRRTPTNEVFAGKASPESSNDVLLGNLAARRSGKVPEVGVLVNASEFSTWDRYEAEAAFANAAKGFRGSVDQLDSIILDRALGTREPGGGFEDRENAVFLPIIGNSPAVTTRSDLVIKPHNYVQLVLDPGRASAEYVAQFFNTPLGLLSRQTVHSGVIPRASLRTIGMAPIVLPPAAHQRQLVGLQRRLDELRAELNAAERDLWRTTGGARSAERTIRGFGTSDSLEAWLPRLPYPLASILWAYSAAMDTRRRTDILFAFFEATAEFLATILLSGLHTNASTFERLRAGVLREVDGAAWRRSTLGFWIVSGSQFAKAVRRMLSGEERALCLGLFKCSGTWIDAMVSKDLFTVLQRVNELRNAWKAHGGIETDEETLLRLERLQTELTAIFGPLTLAFEDVTLVRPRTLQFDGEIYAVVGDDLVGAIVPFKESTRMAISPMRTGRLYLAEIDGRDGLELLPFVRMRPGPPAATACYFYSRMGTDGARFVSYHQAQASEMTELDADLAALVEELAAPVPSE